MIYLDYAANTPVDKEVLRTFCEVTNGFIANPNSSHKLGTLAKSRLEQSTKIIAEIMNVKASEIIYTSGATESNNLAIKGVANAYKKTGKHIITTYLEHSSVTGTVMALQELGFEVDFVDILDNGQVDLEHLKELLRDDTILVSICYVDSELGIKQSIDEIGEILSKYPNCYFHVDATQAVGKISVSLSLVDLMTFAPHKFYGLNGCGILIKKENVLLQPIIHGGTSTTVFRSGTPMLALGAAAEKALNIAVAEIQPRYDYVNRLNKKLREALAKYPKVKINSPVNAVPFILNFSINGIKSLDFREELEKYDIFLSTKSACSTPNTLSRPVYAVTKDKKAALSSLRISLSHLTTSDEIESFTACFDKSYKKLVK